MPLTLEGLHNRCIFCSLFEGLLSKGKGCLDRQVVAGACSMPLGKAIARINQST